MNFKKKVNCKTSISNSGAFFSISREMAELETEVFRIETSREGGVEERRQFLKN